jgi:FAD synthase
MHEFANDFYGKKLKIVLLGEVRKMTTYKNKSTQDVIYA